MIIAIDPGQDGGVALDNGESPNVTESISAEKMPDSINDFIYEYEHELGSKYTYRAYVENVGQYRQGNSGPSSVKFARHCGAIDGVIAAFKIPVVYVAPSKWMKAVLGTVPKEKTERKNAIKLKMQQLYPHLTITLATADALGILTYARSLQ